MNSFDKPFSDPIITAKRQGTADDPYYDITEMVHVINGKTVLTEIPYKFNRVRVIEKVGETGTSFYEVENAVPTTNQFVVNYVQGTLTFHPSQEGSKFSTSYKGMGTHYFPSSRVWTKDNGNGTVETLDDVVTTGSEKIIEITDKISEAEQATLNATNATADFQTMLNGQKVIYKKAVATFANIATTYPTPALGWLVTTKDTKIQWRFDGFSWVEIGYSDADDGLTVVVSQNPPPNINTIWVNVPNGNRTAKLAPSSTEPTDTSVIWWKVD